MNWEQDEVNPKKILSKVMFGLSLLAFVVIGSQSLISYLVKWFNPKLADTDWYSWGLTALTMVIIGLPVYLIFMNSIPDSPKGEVEKLKLSKFIVIFFICASAMYLTNILSSLLTIFIASLKGNKQLLNPALEAIMNSNYFLSLLYVAIVAPIIEELIFRKVLLDKVRRFGDIPAILISGITFGMFHMNLSQFFYAAVLGCIFAYVTIRTNTIRYAIILHMLVNAISSAVVPFVVKGNIILGLVLTLWVFTAVLLGILLFALNFKKIRFDKITPIVQRKDYILNAGAICYASICIIVIGIITIYN